MSPSSTTFTILFCPLLSTITQCLQLPKPQHCVLDQASHEVSITVRGWNGSTVGTYTAGPSTTIESSFEKAAKLAVCDLKKIYDIYVKDVTALRNQETERCTNLWRLKRQELQQLVKGLPKIELVEKFGFPEINHLHVVSIDFVSLLTTITKETHVDCSDIEVIEHTSSFKAWVTINHHNTKHGCKYIYGDTCGTYVGAEQDVAAKVISYLAPIYNLEIVDTNSEPGEYDISALVRENIREKCMFLKEAAPQQLESSTAMLFMAKASFPATPAKLIIRGNRSSKMATKKKKKRDQAFTGGTAR